MQELRDTIERGFEQPEEAANDAALRDAVTQAIELLDKGVERVAEPSASGWQVNQWLKKAVLLSFRLNGNALIEGTYSRFYDKVPLKYANYSAAQFEADGAATSSTHVHDGDGCRFQHQ